MKLARNIILALSCIWLLSCSEEVTDNPVANLLPKTYLWLVPDSTVGLGVSRQSLHWWGEDPDGVVIGYLFAYAIVTENVSVVPSPDTLRYVWITRNDTDMVFPLDTLFRKYVVAVRSVDNNVQRLPERSAVRLSPFPFADKNDNGVFDGADEQLTGLPGSLDPKGAVLTFPIRNTPPNLYFLPNPLDPSLPFKQPDTTYTVATFGWKGTDFDGDNTLASYRIALNDTSDPSNWLTLPLRDTVITLVVPRQRSDAAGVSVTADVYGGQFLGRQFLGQVKGLRLDALNTLFVKAKDVAGDSSVVKTIPYAGQHWYVKRPRGKLLLVGDYINFDAGTASSTYHEALAAVPGGEFAHVDELNIGLGLSASEKIIGKVGPFVPPYVDPALVLTFLLYDYVLWYTDQFPTLSVAQLSLFTYLQNGGKVLFSTTFLNTIDPRGALKDFAPIDSIGSVDLSPTRPPVPPPVDGDTRIPARFILFADSSDPGNIYPQLAFNEAPAIHSVFMRPVYRRSDARYVYHLQADTRNRYIGTPNVGVVDGQRTILFIGLPLHLLNNRVEGNPEGLGALFTKMFTQQFSATQKINRRLF